MKQYIISAIVVCLTMALYAYDPSTPNPSSHDVWEVQNSACQSEQAALHLFKDMSASQVKHAMNKRKFFDDNGVDADGVSAEEFVRRARARGFMVDPRTGSVTVGQGFVLAENFRGVVEKRRQAYNPFTAYGKAVQAEKRKLLWHIHDSGGVYVKAEKDGGTSLYWDGGKDFRGRSMRYPLRLATSARDGLTVDDFIPDSGSPFGFSAPEIKESVMAEQFAKFYKVLTGRTSVTELTPDEQEASDYYDKVVEAGSIVSDEQKEANVEMRKTGSGFFITNDGYLITNNHVVEGGSNFKVLMANGMEIAEVVKQDAEIDLALLKIKKKCKACIFARRKVEKLGTDVFTMGFPMPDIQGFSPKVTKGIISGIDGFMGNIKMYQMDASIQPGNSGGPLFNSNGHVVGVVVASLKGGQVVNYAIKKAYLMAFLDSVPDISLRVQESDTSKKHELSELIDGIRDSCVLVMTD